ncbi:Phloem protein 2-like protein [Melia azedarach]|uniref:Phloem protein 2-like protein n=1 Tax=Melia azedarach TaxID=155640 RepID=A0ACC1WU60_MELAZ|nr:Phloem protein 2-like protein [Melia azedarach]
MGKSFITLFARDLKIAWGEDSRYWRWIHVEDKSTSMLVDAAELIRVCFLEVRAKFDTRILSPGIKYEVAFVMMIKDNAEGWEHPVKFGFVSPNGKQEEREENFTKIKPINEWIEIPVGEFIASSEIKNQVGEMEIYLHGSEGLYWKKGIVIKGVIIRSKN